jgi:hypothetical protein
MPGYFSPISPHSSPAWIALTTIGLPNTRWCTASRCPTTAAPGSGFQPG